MNDYFIQSLNNRVSVSRIINAELEVIKIKGEPYSPLSEFWPLFKQKIEYESDEQLAFIVLADDESFAIDSEIMIAEQFVSSSDELEALIFEKSCEGKHLLTYPKVDVNLDKIIANVQTQVQAYEPEPELEQEAEGDNLQSYFRKKTRKIQRENNKVTGGK